MNRILKYAAVAAVAVAAVSVLPAVAAAQPASPTAPAAAQQENLVPLIEMITADRRGRFYTLNAAEAATAERVNKFTRTTESAGIRLFNRQVAGTVPVHRLRLLTGPQSYLLASNPDEIARLSDPRNPRRQFVDEGVLGYVFQRSQGSSTMALFRYSKNGDWRAARENRADLIAAGFGVDGPLGHVPAG